LIGAIDAAESYHDAGVAAYQRALAISEKALGPDHPDVASALTGIAQESLALGELPAARAAAERALVIRSQPDMPAFELAETRFALARALWSDPAARKRAHALADQAREGFVASADAGTKPLAELTTWLREHP
jgi:tetratricopeptide (TPR) repeat protein